jgi:hypothetical protein
MFMVDIAVAGAVQADPTKAWRALAILVLLGCMMFAAVADQPMPAKGLDPPDRGGPFILGVSALGGPDCLGGCIPSAPARPEK